jgi:hypothetical protein
MPSAVTFICFMVSIGFGVSDDILWTEMDSFHCHVSGYDGLIN